MSGTALAVVLCQAPRRKHSPTPRQRHRVPGPPPAQRQLFRALLVLQTPSHSCVASHRSRTHPIHKVTLCPACFRGLNYFKFHQIIPNFPADGSQLTPDPAQSGGIFSYLKAEMRGSTALSWVLFGERGTPYEAVAEYWWPQLSLPHNKRCSRSKRDTFWEIHQCQT